MSYTPFLIANWSTALTLRLQPWLDADDAQEELFDGFVYRGVMSKREGYNYFATGQPPGNVTLTPYTESRIVHKIVSEAPTSGAINGSNKTFTFTSTPPIARGTYVVTGTNPAQVLTDNGLGAFTGSGIGTINYTTGAVSITFTTAPTSGSVSATYNYYPGNPVMMIANFITNTNVNQLIVADTQFVNRYNLVTNRFDDISPSTPYTGTYFNFFSWVNYASATNAPRLLFSNNTDPIQQYDGSTVTVYVYTLTGVTTLLALLLFQFKDRLILLRTTETVSSVATVYPQRIRISGTGANSDVFDTTATGAGFIDIPDGTWIMGAAFNRDDLIIWTQASTWVLKYTGNDSKPFVLQKIDESRGSDAPFAGITYLNKTTAASRRGLISTDGFRVEREDEDIPDFSYNEIDGNNFALCFAGSVDADRDHYLIYPPQTQTQSMRILTTNYDEDNFSIYRLPLSCMGNYLSGYGITWNDLSIYPDWDAFGAAYSNWESFAFNPLTPFSLGGGHHGEIWRLNVTEQEDNQVKVRDITIVDAVTIQVTTDWNNFSDQINQKSLPADMIFLTGVEGMVEVNDQQYPIVVGSVTSNNVLSLTVPSTAGFGAYTSGGTAERVIPFQALFKQFNPYIEQDKKVRCGWLYMYVSTSGTRLKRNIAMAAATNANPCVITTLVAHNLNTADEVTFLAVGGMTDLNNNSYFITVLSSTTFSLNGIDSTGFGVYTSGGYAAVAEKCKAIIDVITNDSDEYTQPNSLSQKPYRGTVSNLYFEEGSKKWYKIFINQVGRFIQFKVTSHQAGASINIHALMPGFMPVGRII